MIDEQTQEIVAEVLQAIKTNSKTIAQLTSASSISDNDLVEIGGGRKITFGMLKETVLNAIDAAGISVPVSHDGSPTEFDYLTLDVATKTLSYAIYLALNTKLDSSAVVQSTGQGTSKVMSQKAVTDLINQCAQLNNNQQSIVAKDVTVDHVNTNSIWLNGNNLTTNGTDLVFEGDTVAMQSELDGKVDKTTKINGKALSGDVTLTGEDIPSLAIQDYPTVDEALHRLDGDKADKAEVYTKAESDALLDNKADKDGFKTINGESIVGSGDITIEGGTKEIHVGTDEPTEGEVLWIDPNEQIIEQTTGQATDKVMSQKAVTDALAGAGGDWEFIAELNITEPVAYFEQDLGKVYNECMILGIDFKMEAITSGASGYSVNLSINRSNDNRLQLENGSAYTRGFYAHYFNDKDTSRRYVIQTTQITSNTTLKISGSNFPSWASKRTLDKICIEAMSAGMGFTGNFKIYAK